MYHPEGRESAETLKLKPAGKYFDASRSKALQPARKKLPWKSSFQCQIRSTLHFFINTMPLQRPAASNMPGSAPAATPKIPPFADCPRSQYATGHQDWYMISGPQQFPNFDICPTCFNTSIKPTTYARFFSQSPPKPETRNQKPWRPNAISAIRGYASPGRGYSLSLLQTHLFLT